MSLDFKRCRAIVQAQRANYPYLKDATAFSVIGTIMATRRKKVHITADFKPALERCNIPLHEQKAYVQVAADYFNQHGSVIKHGASYGIYNAGKRKNNLKKAG